MLYLQKHEWFDTLDPISQAGQLNIDLNIQ
jgi:hypothetical protein